MSRVWDRAALVLLVVATVAAGWFSLHNLDVWLHARTGQWIVENGQVPSTNVLSRLHADWPTVDDKWGFQVVAHLLLDRIGPDACNAARIALMLALLLTAWSLARRLGAGPWRTLACLLLALLAARTRFTFRPDLVSLLFTVLMVRALLAPRGTARAGWAGLLWLIPLQVLWVNVHGYFITGPLIVLTVAGARFAGGRAERAERAEALRLAGLGALLLAACFLNPAGVKGFLHPFAILADLREHGEFYRQSIIEFRPPLAFDPHQPYDRWGYVALLAAGALLLVWDLARSARDGVQRAERLAALAVFALFAVMSFSLRRNMAPFVLVAAPLVAAAATRRLPAWRPGAALPAAGALLLAGAELSDTLSIHDGHDRRSGAGLSRLAYADAGIDFIARHLPEASVFTAFSYGSTFTGRRWPAQVASTDGNTHGYPTRYLIEVMSALSGEDPTVFDRIVARDGETVALIPMAGPLAMQLLGDPRWALVCVGLREAVFVARRSVAAEWLDEHDLVARWRAGTAVELPGTPCGDIWLGLPKACAPLAELDQALLLMRVELLEPALARLDAAQALRPGDPEALTLRGLIYARQGRAEAAREVVEAALAAPGFNRLQAEARALLEQN